MIEFLCRKHCYFIYYKDQSRDKEKAHDMLNFIHYFMQNNLEDMQRL